MRERQTVRQAMRGKRRDEKRQENVLSMKLGKEKRLEQGKEKADCLTAMKMNYREGKRRQHMRKVSGE